VWVAAADLLVEEDEGDRGFHWALFAVVGVVEVFEADILDVYVAEWRFIRVFDAGGSDSYAAFGRFCLLLPEKQDWRYLHLVELIDVLVELSNLYSLFECCNID